METEIEKYERCKNELSQRISERIVLNSMNERISMQSKIHEANYGGYPIPNLDLEKEKLNSPPSFFSLTKIIMHPNKWESGSTLTESTCDHLYVCTRNPRLRHQRNCTVHPGKHRDQRCEFS